MAFTVAIGSGVAIIPCGNISRTPYTHLLPHLVSTRTRRSLHVARAEKLSSESQPVSTAEIEEPLDDAVSSYNYSDLPGQKPDFWEGPQWDWFGFFVQYSWIIGVPVAAILALTGCLTYDPPKDLKQGAANKYSVQSGEVFVEPDVYDSDVFDSNPTEVAP
ncbi:hypothetical protein CR513_42768, partial [Mucuna pruriens]